MKRSGTTTTTKDYINILSKDKETPTKRWYRANFLFYTCAVHTVIVMSGMCIPSMDSQQHATAHQIGHPRSFPSATMPAIPDYLPNAPGQVAAATAAAAAAAATPAAAARRCYGCWCRRFWRLTESLTSPRHLVMRDDARRRTSSLVLEVLRAFTTNAIRVSSRSLRCAKVGW